MSKEEDLELVQEDYDIIEKERVTGRAFLKITEEKLRSYGMPGGPSSDLADFAKELGKRKLKSFSSYKTLKDLNDVLRKYGIDSNDIKKIPPFVPEPVKIDEVDKHFQYCITDIKRKMGIIEIGRAHV